MASCAGFCHKKPRIRTVLYVSTKQTVYVYLYTIYSAPPVPTTAQTNKNT